MCHDKILLHMNIQSGFFLSFPVRHLFKTNFSKVRNDAEDLEFITSKVDVK